MPLAPFLQKDDKVAIISTARKITMEEVQVAKQLLGASGFQVVLGESVGVTFHQFAGTDAIRINDLQKQLDDPSIKAIWCARGGYGTVRIIDHLDFTKVLQHPKWICGYSDITVLHSRFQRLEATPTLHCLMPINLSNTNNSKEVLASYDSFINAITGKPINYSIPAHPFNKIGTIEAPIVGGNLSILHNLSGTNDAISAAGKILFIEDLDEYLYHIDRMMMQLKKNGLLNQLAGLIIGGMSDLKDNNIPFGLSAYEIIHAHVKEFDYPVVYGFPAGHEPLNLCIPFGIPTQLTVTPTRVSLSCKI